MAAVVGVAPTASTVASFIEIVSAAASCGATSTGGGTPQTRLSLLGKIARPQLTVVSSVGSTCSIAVVTTDNFEPAPQPPVQVVPSGAFSIDADRSSTMRMSGGSDDGARPPGP